MPIWCLGFTKGKVNRFIALLWLCSEWQGGLLTHLTRHVYPLSLVLSPKVSFRYQRQKQTQIEVSYAIISLSIWNLKSFESYMNLLTLQLVSPRHHIGKLKWFAYLLFEARAYVDVYMKLLYPSCLVRTVMSQYWIKYFHPNLAIWMFKYSMTKFTNNARPRMSFFLFWVTRQMYKCVLNSLSTKAKITPIYLIYCVCYSKESCQVVYA